MSRSLIPHAHILAALATILFFGCDDYRDGPTAAVKAPLKPTNKLATETAPDSLRHSTPVPTGETMVKRALLQPAEFDFVDTPLKDVVDSIADKYKINVLLDTKSLADAGVTEDTVITKGIKGISLRAAMHLMLAEHDLAYLENGNNVLLITTAEAAKRRAVRRVYDVRKLASPVSEFAVGRDSWTQLEETITSTIESTTWGGFGGVGSLSAVDGNLVVFQTAEIQSEVADLLAGLEAAQQQGVAALGTGGASAIQCSASTFRARIDSALDSQIDLDFTETMLKDIVDILEKKLDIPVQLDTKGLADAGIIPNSTFSFKLKQVTARLGLHDMLQVKDLDFVIENEVLLITTADVANTKTVTALYPVGDLAAGADSDYAALVEAITSNVRPESWPQKHGVGSIIAFPACKVLVVSQSEQAQQEIASLFSDIRAAQKNHAQSETASNNALVVRVYSLPAAGLINATDDRECQQFAEMVRKFIEPKSWTEQNVSIGCIEGAVIVRQTPDVQRKIQSLLDAIKRACNGGVSDAPMVPATAPQGVLASPFGPGAF